MKSHLVVEFHGRSGELGCFWRLGPPRLCSWFQIFAAGTTWSATTEHPSNGHGLNARNEKRLSSGEHQKYSMHTLHKKHHSAINKVQNAWGSCLQRVAWAKISRRCKLDRAGLALGLGTRTGTGTDFKHESAHKVQIQYNTIQYKSLYLNTIRLNAAQVLMWSCNYNKPTSHLSHWLWPFTCKSVWIFIK